VATGLGEVSAAAGVQLPTIYRQFGDMQGLLGVVARETLAGHVREQATRTLTFPRLHRLVHPAEGLFNPMLWLARSRHTNMLT
jgi:AcrR family transcriptional regulator